MFVVIANYLDYKNQNILAVSPTREEALEIIEGHFNKNYSRHLSLEIKDNVGIVSGYKNTPGATSEEYFIVEPLLS